jgi:isocitrate/isopropylmalate dehydrogenase
MQQVYHYLTKPRSSQKADAILLGAVGGPKWDTIERSIRPERGLLKIRSAVETYLRIYVLPFCIRNWLLHQA